MLYYINLYTCDAPLTFRLPRASVLWAIDCGRSGGSITLSKWEVTRFVNIIVVIAAGLSRYLTDNRLYSVTLPLPLHACLGGVARW